MTMFQWLVGRCTVICNAHLPPSPQKCIPLNPHPPNHPGEISGNSGNDLHVHQNVLWAMPQPLAAIMIMGHIANAPMYAPNWSTGCQGYQEIS